MWHKAAETYLGQHTQVQFIFLNSIFRCNKYYVPETHVNIQSAGATLSFFRSLLPQPNVDFQMNTETRRKIIAA